MLCTGSENARRQGIAEMGSQIALFLIKKKEEISEKKRKEQEEKDKKQAFMKKNQ